MKETDFQNLNKNQVLEMLLQERREADQQKREYQQKIIRNIHKSTWKDMAVSFVIILAVMILITTFIFPILRIYGNSMENTLTQGDVVVSVANAKPKRQDLIAFYYQNKILIKRVIGCAGDWIDIDKEGCVKVNGEVLDEPYVWEAEKGECDIELPYQVPEGKFFVMGDHRSVSADSRSTEIGCVEFEQVIGKVIFRIWPLENIGRI